MSTQETSNTRAGDLELDATQAEAETSACGPSGRSDATDCCRPSRTRFDPDASTERR